MSYLSQKQNDTLAEDLQYDSDVPSELKKIQQWFASIITRPINQSSQMNSLSPTGKSMKKEAPKYIQESHTLRPEQRIEIYNQQYWWRLLDNMQDAFPLLTRMFGYHEFNKVIAMPYLVNYPPDTWVLSGLGSKLPQWIEEKYHAKDKQLVYLSACIDLSYILHFVASELPSLHIDPAQPHTLFEAILQLQPSCCLFELPYELFDFRFAFMKEEPDYWLEHEFPPLVREKDNQPIYFILYRNPDLDMVVEKISKGEYCLLQRFKLSSNIDAICQWLENEAPSWLADEAAEQLHLWAQKWTNRRWLGLASQ